MIGKAAAKGVKYGTKAVRELIARKTRKVKGKEVSDVTVPADVAHREGVLGARPEKAHTPPTQREAGLIAGGKSTGQRKGFGTKKKTLDRLDNELTTKESRIDVLRKQSKKAEDPKTRMRLTTQIQKLQARIKSIKELMKLEVKGMKGMIERQGPAVQVKTGGTIKRSTGGLIGMGAALRGGGAIRKR